MLRTRPKPHTVSHGGVLFRRALYFGLGRGLDSPLTEECRNPEWAWPRAQYVEPLIHLSRGVYKVRDMTGKRVESAASSASASSSSSPPSPAMRVHKDESRNLLFVLCFLIRTTHSAAMKNDATEIVYPHTAEDPGEAPADEAALNRARSGGRGSESAARERAAPGPMGCRELRSTKYISDGQCTSINPIKELVCAGECLAAQALPNWIGGYGRKQRNRQSGQDWRCVNDKTRTERIQLQCQDGSTRTYKITVVTSCKCKRYLKQHNESANKSESITQRQQVHKPKSKRKHRNSKVNGNWHESES